MAGGVLFTRALLAPLTGGIRRMVGAYVSLRFQADDRNEPNGVEGVLIF
jgi:hypothetical protein